MLSMLYLDVAILYDTYLEPCSHKGELGIWAIMMSTVIYTSACTVPC